MGGANMANTIRAFDFEIDFHGACVVPATSQLCHRCLSDTEVDANIQALKDDLDAVAKRMKRAIRAEVKKPLFPESK
jgi:hypothetical protein